VGYLGVSGLDVARLSTLVAALAPLKGPLESDYPLSGKGATCTVQMIFHISGDKKRLIFACATIQLGDGSQPLPAATRRWGKAQATVTDG